MPTEILCLERPAEEAPRRFADDDGIRRCQRLQARRHVGGLADDGHVGPRVRSPDFARHHEAGVDADPDGDRDAALGAQPAIESGDPVQNLEARAGGPMHIVLVGAGIAEVHHEAIAQGLGNMAFEPAQRLRTRILIGAENITEILGIEALRQRGRSDQIAKHHGELAALGLGHQASGAVGTGSHRFGKGRFWQRLAAATAKLLDRFVDETARGACKRQWSATF